MSKPLSDSERLKLYEKLKSSEEFKAEDYNKSSEEFKVDEPVPVVPESISEAPEVREHDNWRVRFPPELMHALKKYGTLGTILGKGAYGVVVEIVPNKPGDRLVAKIIFNDRANWLLEREHARKIRHEHSLTWIDEGKLTVRGNTVDWFIYPRADMSGDDLLEEFKEQKTSENERWRVAKSMVWQLLNVVELMHDRNIVHNDIFLRNILVNRPKVKGGKYTFFLNDYGAVRTHQELIESYHPPHQEDVDYLLNAAAYLARGYHVDMFHIRVATKELRPWMQRCRNILKLLPKGARVPFARLKNAIRTSRTTDAPMVDQEAHLAKLKEAIDMLDKERTLINMALATASTGIPGESKLRLTSKQFMIESIRQRAASIVEAHISVLAMVYILEDEDGGGEPWVSFVPTHRENYAQRGASIPLQRMLSNVDSIPLAVRQCRKSD